MADLSSVYLGLPLKNPLVPSSSPHYPFFASLSNTQ